jgi:hypothetical protein
VCLLWSTRQKRGLETVTGMDFAQVAAAFDAEDGATTATEELVRAS